MSLSKANIGPLRQAQGTVGSDGLSFLDGEVATKRGLNLSKTNIRPFDKLRARSAGVGSLDGEVAAAYRPAPWESRAWSH